MASNLIARYFAGPRYITVEEVLNKVEEISSQIQLKSSTTPRIARESQLIRLVHELAPMYLHGHYKVKEMVHEILRREGKSTTEFNITQRRVRKALMKLKERRLIPLTTPHDKSRQPKLRDVTPAQVKKHIGLVHFILQRGHKFVVSNWRRHLSYKEAQEIGEEALREALEIHNPARYALSAIAVPYIAGRISQAVRTKRRQSRFVSMDQPGNRDERTLHEKIAAPAVKQPELQRSLETLLRSRLLQNHHLAVFALRMYGHKFGQIAGHFGAKRQAAYGLYKRAVKFLKRRTLEDA